MAEEAEARAKLAAAESLAELGLDDSLNSVSDSPDKICTSVDQVKKSRKKNRGKKKKMK